MNIYDTANRLAQEIKQSEEYMNYKMAKQALNLNTRLKEKMVDFDKLRYEVQIEMMQTGKNDEEKDFCGYTRFRHAFVGSRMYTGQRRQRGRQPD